MQIISIRQKWMFLKNFVSFVLKVVNQNNFSKPKMDVLKKTKGNATAIIALTASVLEEEKAITLSAGCDDFMRKPFKESMIFETLNKHLGVKYIDEELGTEEVKLEQSPSMLSSIE